MNFQSWLYFLLVSLVSFMFVKAGGGGGGGGGYEHVRIIVPAYRHTHHLHQKVFKTIHHGGGGHGGGHHHGGQPFHFGKHGW